MIQRSRECGTEYHEAAMATMAGPVCSCGTFAIGTCTVCDIPVCGNCSRMTAGKRLCTAHATKAANESRESKERQARETAQAAEQKTIRERDRREGQLDELKRIVDELVAMGAPEATNFVSEHSGRFSSRSLGRGWVVSSVSVHNAAQSDSYRPSPAFTDQGGLGFTLDKRWVRVSRHKKPRGDKVFVSSYYEHPDGKSNLGVTFSKVDYGAALSALKEVAARHGIS